MITHFSTIKAVAVHTIHTYMLFLKRITFLTYSYHCQFSCSYMMVLKTYVTIVLYVSYHCAEHTKLLAFLLNTHLLPNERGGRGMFEEFSRVRSILTRLRRGRKNK